MNTKNDLCIDNLLLVDDDANVLSALTRLLRPFCDRIDTALCGEQALEILACRHVSLIISDLLIPPITGVELFRRAKHAEPGITTILLSGKSDTATVLLAKQERILNAFIPKPWDNDGLLAVIGAAMSVPSHIILEGD